MAEIKGEYEMLEAIKIKAMQEEPQKPYIFMVAAQDAEKIITFCCENNISIYIGER
jgi:response regulator RpfG family c-di-GMP phosphodiesterase